MRTETFLFMVPGKGKRLTSQEAHLMFAHLFNELSEQGRMDARSPAKPVFWLRHSGSENLFYQRETTSC